MSDAKVRGVVHLVEETKTYGSRGFRKRLVVLEQDTGRFTNYIPLEFTQEACDSIDELKAGDEIEVSYRLSGRKWQKDENSEVRFFLNAEATGFEVLSKGPPTSAPDVNDQFSAAAEEDDEIPF